MKVDHAQMEEPWFFQLPLELIADVFERITLKDLLRCQAVSKLWREKLWNTQSWLEVTENHTFSVGLHNVLAKFNQKLFQELHMYDYELSEVDIAQICRLTNIHSLIYEEPFDSMHNSKHTKLDYILSTLTRLHHLTLGLWHEHEVDLRHLTRLTELTALEIDVTACVTLTHFDALSHLTQLTHFTFYAPVLPSVPSETFVVAMQWPRMRSLALILKAPTDLIAISQYTQLVDLELQSLHVTDEYLTFHSWTSLTRLHLTCSRATVDSFTKLSALTDLRELTITKNGHLKDLVWISSLVNLRKINFGHTKINDADIELLATLPNLAVLNICSCRSTTSKAVKTLSKMTHLKQLNISESGILFSSRRADVLDALSGAIDLLIANDVHGPSDLGWE